MPSHKWNTFEDIPYLLEQLDVEDNTVLSEERVQSMVDSLSFMRTSAKNNSCVFVDNEGRVMNVRLLAQMAGPIALMGSIQFVPKTEVCVFPFNCTSH